MNTQEALKSSPMKCLGLAVPVSYFSAVVMHSATTAASTRVYFGFFFQKIESSSWRELCGSQAWQQEQAVESVHIKMVYFLQQGFPSHRYFKPSSSQTAPAKDQVFKYGSLRGDVLIQTTTLSSHTLPDVKPLQKNRDTYLESFLQLHIPCSTLSPHRQS